MKRALVLGLSLCLPVNLVAEPKVVKHPDLGYRISNHKPGTLKAGSPLGITYECSLDNGKAYKYRTRLKGDDLADYASRGEDMSLEFRRMTVALRTGEKETKYANDGLSDHGIYEFAEVKVLEIRSLLDILAFNESGSPEELSMKERIKKEVALIRHPVTLKLTVKAGMADWPFRYRYGAADGSGYLQRDSVGSNRATGLYARKDNDNLGIGVEVPYLPRKAVETRHSRIGNSLWCDDIMSLDIIEHGLQDEVSVTTLLLDPDRPSAAAILHNLGLTISCKRVAR